MKFRSWNVDGKLRRPAVLVPSQNFKQGRIQQLPCVFRINTLLENESSSTHIIEPREVAMCLHIQWYFSLLKDPVQLTWNSLGGFSAWLHLHHHVLCFFNKLFDTLNILFLEWVWPWMCDALDYKSIYKNLLLKVRSPSLLWSWFKTLPFVQSFSTVVWIWWNFLDNCCILWGFTIFGGLWKLKHRGTLSTEEPFETPWPLICSAGLFWFYEGSRGLPHCLQRFPVFPYQCEIFRMDQPHLL